MTAHRSTTPYLLTLALGAGVLAAPTAVRAEPLAAAPADRVPVPAEGRNAALAYLRTFNMYVWSDVAAAARAVKYVPVATADAARVEPEGFAGVKPLLDDAASGMDALREAAALDRYDMELDYAQGWNLLLPHLGPMRGAAAALRADARRAALDNKPEVAVRRVWTMLRIASHMPNDRVLISGLVAARIAADAADEIDVLRLLVDLSPDQRTTLANALRTLKTDDPFMFRATILNEGEVIVTTLRTFNSPDAGKRFQDLLLSTTAEADAPRDPAIDAMDGAALAREIDKIRDYHAQAAAALSLPDDGAALARLLSKDGKRAFGPVVAATTADFSKIRATSAELSAKIDAALKWLDAR